MNIITTFIVDKYYQIKYTLMLLIEKDPIKRREILICKGLSSVAGRFLLTDAMLTVKERIKEGM